VAVEVKYFIPIRASLRTCKSPKEVKDWCTVILVAQVRRLAIQPT